MDLKAGMPEATGILSLTGRRFSETSSSQTFLLLTSPQSN
jgi:hypothetical protein